MHLQYIHQRAVPFVEVGFRELGEIFRYFSCRGRRNSHLRLYMARWATWVGVIVVCHYQEDVTAGHLSVLVEVELGVCSVAVVIPLGSKGQSLE